eukprot:5686955-Karenia_brevis.AAC.1
MKIMTMTIVMALDDVNYDDDGGNDIDDDAYDDDHDGKRDREDLGSGLDGDDNDDDDDDDVD